MRWVIVLLVIIPALEIWTLYSVAQWIGGWPTFLLVVLTGLVGVVLVRREAHKVYAYAQRQMAEGQIPGQQVLEGICLFAGGLLLLLPGFLTDVAGFLLVLPFTRNVFKQRILHLIRSWIDSGRFTFMIRR